MSVERNGWGTDSRREAREVASHGGTAAEEIGDPGVQGKRRVRGQLQRGWDGFGNREGIGRQPERGAKHAVGVAMALCSRACYSFWRKENLWRDNRGHERILLLPI